MGRALFSQTYSSPAVRSEPEPVLDNFCQKWSLWNKFDPDSDEFFADAEYEAFIDPRQLRHMDVEVVEMVLSPDSSSESTIDGGSSDAGSPMATGPDDPAAMIASAYPNVTAEQWELRTRELTAASEWLSDFPERLAQRFPPTEIAVNTAVETSREAGEEGGEVTATRSYRPNRPRSASAAPALVPLSALLTQTRPAQLQPEQIPTPPLSPAAATSVVDGPASPIRVMVPVLYPTTPQRRNVRGPAQTMFSPSPPPSVTPRYYSWQSHPIPAVPASPTSGRGNRDGLLTNPHARRSFARLGNVQAPVLVSNPAN